MGKGYSYYGGRHYAGEVWRFLDIGMQDNGRYCHYSSLGEFPFAIHQGWPGEVLELDNLQIKPGTEIRMLGVEVPLSWKAEGDKIIVNLPSEKPCEHAFVLKMELD